MQNPSNTFNLHKTLQATLKKMAVLVVCNNNERFLVSQSKNTIEPFNNLLACYLYTCDTDKREIECYELRYDKLITIDIRDVSHLVFIGLGDISPAIYINSMFEGVLPDDKLQELQYKNFLKGLLERRNAGLLAEVPYSQERIIELQSLKMHIRDVLKIPLNCHELFNIIEDTSADDLYMYTNIIDGDRLLKMSEYFYFIQAIFACYDISLVDATPEMISKYIDQLFDLHDLKQKWIEKLEHLRKIFLDNLNTDKSNINDYIRNELTRKFEFKATTQTIQHMLGASDVDVVPNEDEFEVLKNELIEKIIEYISIDEFNSNNIKNTTHDLIVFYLNTYSKTNDIKEDIASSKEFELINNLLFELGTHVFNSTVTLIEQYNTLLDQATNTDFVKELDGIDDFRIFLRYWPEFLELSPLILTEIRSFSSCEMEAIKIFLSEGIRIEDEKFNSKYNNWSIFTLLQDKTDIVRERRLEQVKEAAQSRVEDLKKEMGPVFDTLSEEEQGIFNNMLKDITNTSVYADELNNEKTIKGVLSYWPLVLYPKPDYILHV